MGASGRTEINAQYPQDFARAIHRRAKVVYNLLSARPYAEKRVFSYTANTASGPNAVEPADSAIILTDDVSHVALFPEWTALTASVKVRTWPLHQSGAASE
jgi:hypothetical protein